MAIKKSNLAGIAKKKNTSNKVTSKTNIKTETLDKNQKAKETVEKLLNDVDLSPKKKEQVTEEIKKIEGSEWLEEQVSILTEENEKLRKESEEAKINYKKLYNNYQTIKSGNVNSNNSNNVLIPDSELTNNIKAIFNELQKNMLGQNPERKRYSDVKIAHILKKFIEYFPFIKEIKRF